MIKANFNTYNNYVTDSLYQWDVNRDLVINGLNLSTAPEIHFANSNMVRAIVKQSTLEGGVVTVRIPNSLLQEALTIKAYVGLYEGDTFKVIETIEIPVIARTKPDDYVIETSDGEVYSFIKLENEIINAKNEIAEKCDANLVALTTTVERAKDDLESEVDEITNTLDARVDNIIAHNNDTESNTELLDIRTSADGTVYESAGTAVRCQVGDLKNTILTGEIIKKFPWEIGSIVSSGGYGKDTNAHYPYAWRTPSSKRFVGDDKETYFRTTFPTGTLAIFKYTLDGTFVERRFIKTAWNSPVVFSSEYKYALMYEDENLVERPPIESFEAYTLNELDYVPKIVSEEIENKVNDLRNEIAETEAYESNDTLYLTDKKIKIFNPFKDLGENQYKGQMHAHHISGENYDTEAWTVQEFVNAHASAGYDFLTLTDYRMVGSISQKAEDMKGLVWLCSATEEAVGKNEVDGTPTTHICTYFVESLLGSFTSVNTALKAFAEAGRISSLAHPMLSGKEWTSEKIANYITDCKFVEVWNGLGDDHEKRGDDWILDKYANYTDYAFDLMLSLGMNVFCTAVSDIHGESSSIINNGYVKVFANNKSRTDIWDSLLSGKFYSSNGATINSVSLTDDVLSVEVENGATIEFVGENGSILSTISGTNGAYTFTGEEKYVRIRVTDTNGYKAWTQAVVLDI